MSCKTIQIPGTDTFAIICSRGQRPKLCSVQLCGKPSVALRDMPVERKGVKGTCDSPMCELRRHPVGENVDWCQAHWDHEQRLANKAKEGS